MRFWNDKKYYNCLFIGNKNNLRIYTYAIVRKDKSDGR